MRADRQTDTLITRLRTSPGGEVKILKRLGRGLSP